VNAVAQVFAVVAGFVHVAIWFIESLLFRRPAFHRLFRVRPEHVPVVRLWAVNQGFYNLFLGVGAIGGVVTLHLGNETVGRTLVLFCCACMTAAGVVLVFSERRLWRGALVQAVPPLVVLLASLA
jgi:putative membrane protein